MAGGPKEWPAWRAALGSGLQGGCGNLVALEQDRADLGHRVGAVLIVALPLQAVHQGQGVLGAGSGEAHRLDNPAGLLYRPAILVARLVGRPRAPDPEVLHAREVAQFAGGVAAQRRGERAEDVVDEAVQV